MTDFIHICSAIGFRERYVCLQACASYYRVYGGFYRVRHRYRTRDIFWLKPSQNLLLMFSIRIYSPRIKHDSLHDDHLLNWLKALNKWTLRFIVFFSLLICTGHSLSFIVSLSEHLIVYNLGLEIISRRILCPI